LTAKALHLDGEHSQIRGTFDANEISIGRYAECDVVLPDPDHRISRVQARILHINDQYVVCNASTSNPMYVNEVELSPGSSQVMGDSDELRVGSYVVIVSSADEVSQPAQLQRDQSEVFAAQTSASPQAPPASEQGGIQASASPLKVEPILLSTGGLDPNDPFGDLLGHALPVGSMGGTTSGMTGDPVSSSLSRQDMGTPPVELQSEYAAPNVSAASNLPRQPEDQHTLANPFDLLVSDAAGASRGQKPLADSALPGLAGDPFADLMGPPIESHMANAPAFDSASQRTLYIPADFNPLAAGGVSQRNSSDPLASIGLNAQGLSDVIPENTIDSIYNPSSESATTLAVDPLQQTQGSVLSVGQNLDPLKLFGHDSLDLMPGNPEADTGGSTRNDAPEMETSFRAPIPRVDSGTPPREPGQDILTEPNLDVVESKSVDAPMPSDGAAQLTPDPSTTYSSMVAKSAVDSQFNSRLESQDQEAGTLIAAFKRGAGLEEWPATAITPELMETIGRLLQTAAQGMVSLVAARAAVKQEIRLSATLINPKSNNPLKFLPDGHTALLQMLGPKIPGFIAPVDAMEEAFDDLLTHQTAIAAGTQAMIEALFQRFDPDSIKSEYPKSGIREKLWSTQYNARLWSTYTEQYRLIKEEISDDFFKRLGTEFHDAYNKEYDHHANDEN
jgi:FHA domain-containing protein